jgi:DNA-binding response OmpR family regulator
LFACQDLIRLEFAYVEEHALETVPWGRSGPAILNANDPREISQMAEVGVLIVDDDIASQHALKNVFDSEGWRVGIVRLAADAMLELSTGAWNLVIVNVTLLDLRGPLFATLKALAQAELLTPSEGADQTPRKRIRVLFLVPAHGANGIQAVLEREELPYSLKPYHLHDFLEKISELLVEAGAIAEPIRRDFFDNKKRLRNRRVSHDRNSGAMFASREDYQMSEEELAEFERQEEADRRKQEKEQKGREQF